MKLRLKINPNLTRDELIERLPEIIKSATEALLEKGRKIHGSIEKDLFKAHPVKAIAASESEFYDQGHASLMGIQSWLLGSLKIETIFKKSFSKDEYKAEFHEKHGVTLGSSVTLEQSKKLSEILSLIPNEALQNRVRLISVDNKFGSSKKKYPNHGRYYEEFERIVLNPHIFGEETIYRDGEDKAIEKITHTLLHEIGHSIDDDFGLSAKKEWRDISDWKFIGDKDPADGAERLLLQEGNVTTLKGKWSYKKGTEFARWYGARNPKEDFCEAFAFAVLGATQYFKGKTGKKKKEFVEKIIKKLIKSESPGDSLEGSDDTEILKSQDFKSYYDTRSIGLVHLDELEAIQIAKSEFVGEACGDLYLEKADTPQPGAAPAPAPAQGTPQPKSGALNPLKGLMKPGHKYLRREPLPGGGFKYFYQMSSGSHFNSDEPLHDEGEHMAHFKSEEEWNNYKQNITLEEQMPNVDKEEFEAQGGKVEHFDPIEVPKLIPDEIKPTKEMFDPEKHGDDPVEEDENKEKPEWRHHQKSRDEQNFSMAVDNSKNIEAAQKTWEIEEVDANWGTGGIQLKFRIKLKNDGWHILKPKAGSLQYKNDPVRRLDEMSTIHREAMAFEIDKVLGWNLVPPTVVRDLKGVGNRKVFDAMTKKLKRGDHYNVLDAFKGDKVTEASMQFLAEDAELLLDSRNLGKVDKQEVMRAIVFDMISNHQDRHQNNMMLMKDNDSDSRYGGKWRLVLIDNGYMAGYGNIAKKGTYDRLVTYLKDFNLDKKTIRNLRKLRDDIRDKKRRHKIFSEGTRNNVTGEQIDRIAHRIDFMLSKRFRDSKGQVTMSTWSEMSKWESATLGIPEWQENNWVADAVQEPFDISGKTAIVGKAKGAVEQFKHNGEIKDFLAPMLPYLNSRQKETMRDVMVHFEKNGAKNIHRPMREVIKNLPKKLVNQLFVKQLFHERLGMSKLGIQKTVFAVEQHLETDHLGLVKDQIRYDHVEEFNKLERGEIEIKDLKGVLDKDMWDGVQDLWLVPHDVRGVGKNLTERIFEDPEHFGWGEEAPREEGRKPFEPLPEEKFVEKSQGEPELMVSLGNDDAE